MHNFVKSGTNESNYSRKMGISKFEMIVDNQTGALLTFKVYNENSEPVTQLKAIEYVVDKDIINNIFDDLSNL